MLIAVGAGAAAIGVSGGCGRDDSIAVYSAPKDAPPSTAPSGAMAPFAGAGDGMGAPGAASASPEGQGQAGEAIHWTVPAAWKSLSAGQMRFAAFQVAKDDPNVVLTVVPLGPEAGDLKANVNRWEGQIGLPPSDESALSKVVKPLDIAGVQAQMVDLTSPEKPGEPKQRMLAAILPRPDRVWFFKLLGPIDVVSAQQANFDAFLRSVRFDQNAAETAGSTAPQPQPQPQAGGAASEVNPNLSGATATWTAPAGWEKLGQRPMRVATFRAGTGEHAAELIISQFGPGQAGGLLDNINRWRGQVGLPAIADLKNAQRPSTVSLGGVEGWIYDFTGPAEAGGEPAKRIRVALTVAGQRLWFFKLQGSADAVQQQQSAFDRFLESVKFE